LTRSQRLTDVEILFLTLITAVMHLLFATCVLDSDQQREECVKNAQIAKNVYRMAMSVPGKRLAATVSVRSSAQ
jgi:hypothetical protein